MKPFIALLALGAVASARPGRDHCKPRDRCLRAIKKHDDASTFCPAFLDDDTQDLPKFIEKKCGPEDDLAAHVSRACSRLGFTEGVPSSTIETATASEPSVTLTDSETTATLSEPAETTASEEPTEEPTAEPTEEPTEEPTVTATEPSSTLSIPKPTNSYTPICNQLVNGDASMKDLTAWEDPVWLLPRGDVVEHDDEWVFSFPMVETVVHEAVDPKWISALQQDIKACPDENGDYSLYTSVVMDVKSLVPELAEGEWQEYAVTVALQSDSRWGDIEGYYYRVSFRVLQPKEEWQTVEVGPFNIAVDEALYFWNVRIEFDARPGNVSAEFLVDNIHLKHYPKLV